MSNKIIKVIAVFVISVSVFLSISSTWDDSVIVDEVPHIGAGYSYLVKKDMRLNPEHPPLAKDLAAIPLLFLNLKEDVFNTKFWQTDLNGQWDFGRFLMFGSQNDADQIKHWVKLPMMIFFAAAAVLVFKWARRLYGSAAAIIALIFFTFSPTVMAHARFITTDIPALLGVLLTTYFFIRWLNNQSRKNLIISGLASGVAFLTKFSTFLIMPYFVFLALIFGLFKTVSGTRVKIKTAFGLIGKTILSFFVAFILVVWPVYYFHTYNMLPELQKKDTQMLLSSFGNRTLAEIDIWLADKPIIRALGQYGLGLLMVAQRATGGNTTYFLGEVSSEGWKHYFPIVYFIKEPLAWWLAVVIAILAISTKIRLIGFKPTAFAKATAGWIKNHFEELAMLIWIVFYWASSIESNLNIGVRHLLPTYPFVIILVSGQLARIKQKIIETSHEIHKLGEKTLIYSLGLAVLLSWYLYENFKVYPYYLTYFNQIAGGPAGGYRYVVDSNLDWGQDLLRLSRWVKEKSIPKIEVDYFGWADPFYYLGDRYIWLSSNKYQNALDFKLRNQANGWLAVSATFLQGSRGIPNQPSKINYDSWLKSFVPVTVIGNSIFVYQIK